MKIWIGVLMLACATACDTKKEGDSKKEHKLNTIAGVELPATVIPPTLDFPAVFPRKIGDTMVDSELYDLEKKQPGVRLFYKGDQPPNHRRITGYVIVFAQDPVPDLTKNWGPATEGPTRGTGISTSTESNRCWENPTKHVKACVIKLREKTEFYLEITPLP